MGSKAIRRLRRRHGWTQSDLAQRLGTDAVTVSRWERGVSRPRRSAVARLRALSNPTPGELESLIATLGRPGAERLLQRALLLSYRPARHRFSADPTRRLRDVDRARQEQAALKAGIRLKQS